ncbi:survival protein sure-like phosphatase/nucleotidase [Daedalea quercina L-15889]|uniref:Survival protein sure-like phosphatase/nucleotidase n=1 Tax=Daedalea quercina L-15889 TaxID=1314783 RepID=A0A165SRA3_9APHY|nr:survival protein sure-like phosphatase/nucleotidase [Daedalea quercina L-15889]
MFRFQGILALVSLALSFAPANAQTTLVISNDDGWATAQIRAQYEALSDAGYDVILSCPALNQSGKGSQTTTPEVLAVPCQFDTCPAGSPPFGYNASDPHLNYVNAYPVDAATYGIQTLSPQIFGSGPDFLVSGPNIGPNIGVLTQLSGTVGAASAASLQGIPAAAFSGFSGAQVSYTTLTSDPDANSTLAARIYSALTVQFVDTLLNGSAPGPFLPAGVIVNVNYPSINGCGNESDYEWVFARNLQNNDTVDAQTCGSDHLPTELQVVTAPGCYASVSAISAVTKTDVDNSTQAAVLNKLVGLPLSCLP